MYQQTQPFGDFRSFFRVRTSLTWIILINVAIYALIQVIRVILFLSNRDASEAAMEGVVHLLGVPASLPVLIEKPWTLFTYMFLHLGIWHILFNLLWLYWFGKIFLEFLSRKALVWVYILGGLTGGVVYIAAFNIFPVFSDALPVSYALGASASVMAIVTAISCYVPSYTLHLLFFGKVKIVYLAIALFVIDFFMIPAGNAGGHIAHIGGALFGFFYAMTRKPLVKNVLFKDISDFFNKLKKMFPGRSGKFKADVNPGRPLTDDEYNFNKAENQKKIDKILEKISKGGYDSLTREEKEFLFNSSRKSQ